MCVCVSCVLILFLIIDINNVWYERESFFMLFGQLGMLFVFMCVCVSCVLIPFLIVDIRNPLEEMVLKIYSTLIFAKSFDLWCVFNRSDVLFFLFSCDIIFFFLKPCLFLFSSLYHWEHVFFPTRFFLFLLHHSSKCDQRDDVSIIVFLEFGGLNSNSSLTVFLT